MQPEHIDYDACAPSAGAPQARSKVPAEGQLPCAGQGHDARESDVRLRPDVHEDGAQLPTQRQSDVRTIALTVAYNGAPFCGFARQPGMLTVQGELEHALGLVFRRPVETVCSGRTDAGVHARGQVVSFDLTADEWEGRSPARVMRSLNALTHDGVSVRAVEEAAPGFSARFDAQWREYHYHICTEAAPPLFLHDFSWHVTQPLDVDAMRQAAQHLVGEHDFKSFCLAASAVGKTTVRTVFEISIDEGEVMGERVLTVKVVGNAFLHSMVRTIVGTLVAVGRGRKDPQWTARVLEARDRGQAGENAPAEGLVFWRVQYGPESGLSTAGAPGPTARKGFAADDAARAASERDACSSAAGMLGAPAAAAASAGEGRA